MIKKRSTMLASEPIRWRTIKVSDDAYRRIVGARQAHDSINDAVERLTGIKRGDRVRKIAANLAAKANKRTNKNKKTDKTKGNTKCNKSKQTSKQQ
jgi:predicted CopG family antitoxin